ncbi:hypothetical protein HPB50_023239 [Hyalomma asiaticum]|uniref:Uncharacterized protein n=1 Tax=Hyalomma asiaticum TaxID=266040 RepID=A0ACB7TTJ0_HYAAI|nr:hypothetical protein HPB50_023239 [Hyalomma asiaticum]
MHPQLQDLVEGKQFANLEELAKAADGLMERYWRRFQYKPRPPPTDQVTRDLAFRPAANGPGLSGAPPRVMAAAAAPFQHSVGGILLAVAPRGDTTVLPPGPAAQIARFCYQATFPYAATAARIPTTFGGIDHMGRECPSGRRKGPPRFYQCNGIGHIRYQCPGNGRR